ncbi:MAG: hypothetical protein FJY92_07615, partial [Candidatus Hydrogenedentes bacterium]|nr:hypothetical protein [Candidatus Hydrogenedentota bacterium]
MATLLFAALAGLATLYGCGPQPAPAPSEPAPEPAPLAEALKPPAPPKAAPLKVVGTVPLPGDPLKGRITVFFSEDIKVDGQDAPEAAAPFTMQPDVPNTYTIGPNFIDIHSDKFSATEPVQVILGESVKSSSGNAIETDARTLNFAPFVFEVRRLWQVEQSAEREVVAILFPTDVAPAAVQQNTSVTDAAGVSVEASVEAGSHPEIARLIIPTGVKLPVTITIGTGLTDATGAFTLAQEYTAVYPTFSDLVVTVVEWGEPDGASQRVVVKFSRAVSGPGLMEHLAIKDQTGGAVDYELVSDEQTTAPAVRVTLPDPANTDLTIDVSAGLEGIEHATLREAVSKKLLARA